MSSQIYDHEQVRSFAVECLEALGLEPRIASVVSGRIVDADLAGHDTHGMAQLPRYLREIDQGLTTLSGDIETISRRGGCLMFDGRMMPGHWVVERAIESALDLVPEQGVVSAAVRRSQHIGALQVYLPSITRHGYLGIIWATDSKVRSVAPFGGLDPVLTSEPVAAGLPTRGDPILIDTTTSLTSNGFAGRAKARGERLPWPALLSNTGEVTDDPTVLDTDPPGSILPLGGAEHGYKGYALAMLVSALSLGLPGWGRATGEKTQGFFLQIIDPAAFGGREAFLDETDLMARETRQSRAIDPQRPVRVPGDGALHRRARQMRDGLELSDGIVGALRPWADRLAVSLPVAR
ncbi:hypothetical protein GTW25_00850 [Aliihoeflea aestuarii]|jgi:LDH2 family malate/lactate/ureidoglycolate dehydrogenase|uniref:Ldh family oxidoreductase n=1 Tax=Aliihoeflea aestuarii TaxID=453840 RepID=UPI00209356BF|nr:Ldh family oxidoreductase [Aliihoeflea aestuarii]MCO6389578.1 hypothetical protein [Aliihoeflea aestuarii]